MPWKKYCMVLFAFVVLALAAPSPALAISCNEYATRSVEQMRENQNLRCGFSGSAWNMDGVAHYNWCKGGNRGDALLREIERRERQLKNCRADRGRRQGNRQGNRNNDGCRAYADRAVAQNAQNIRDRCGFRGSRWSSDRNAHYNWCRQVGAGRANQENDARQNDLSRCGRTGSDCGWYANNAVQQAQRNLDRGCGYSGSRWSTSRATHLQWCRQSSRQDVVAETDAREDMLTRCAGRRGAGLAGDKRSSCERFARDALRQADAARDAGCGFNWRPTYDRSFTWCMDGGLRRAQTLLRERDEQLARCQSRRGGGGYGDRRNGRGGDCEYYARTAVEQSERAHANNCGFNWSRDYRRHYDYCRRVDWNRAQDMLRKRDERLRRCRW